jgi:hypothetical protein
MEGFDWFKESSLGAVMLYLPFPDRTEALRPWQIPTELISVAQFALCQPAINFLVSVNQ